MGQHAATPLRPTRLWPSEVEVEERPDGAILVRSPRPLAPYPARLLDRLHHWAKVAPERTFMAKRGLGGDWRRLTYADTLRSARAIGQALLDRGLSENRPVLILSGNDLEHALLALGAQYAGIPHAPISPAYSLVSTDFAKLKAIVARLTPGLVFAADGRRFETALRAAVPDEVELAVTDAPPSHRPATAFASLAATTPTATVDGVHAATEPDTITKFLLTSGSTGTPKAVVNTERMVASNQVMIRTALACLEDEPPVIVDWLPWNHTFGGNHNVGIALFNGGTLYVDEGKPTPEGIGATVANLKEIAPTIYFNVPKGFEALVPHLRADQDLRRNFFSRLQMNFFAGAGLASHVWDDLDDIALRECGERIVMMSGLGATETAPSAMFCTREIMRSGAVGLPLPGVELKLLPNGGKLEARFRGPSITPGYWREPALTAAAFDEEGFYRIGDALKFADRADPLKGFFFDGRLSEDFKLSTGTWVSVGPMRARFIAAFAPFAKDVVVAGHDRDDVGALMLPDLDALRGLCSRLPPDAAPSEILHHPGVCAAMAERLEELARSATGSATRFVRLAFLDEPLSIDASEVTDKGSINQRAVIARRAALVEALYAETPPDHVIRLPGIPR